MKDKTMLVALVLAGSLWTMAACGAAATPAPTQVPAETTAPPTAAPSAAPSAAATEAATAAAAEAAKPEATAEIARPTNPGGPGEAVNLKGDTAAGAKLYIDTCKKCHGDAGKGGVANLGSTDGTIPALNPIDATMLDKDPKVTITNIDLFLEHGSTPGGPSPKEKMDAFGDGKKLTPQQIADVIAYVVSLNTK